MLAVGEAGDLGVAIGLGIIFVGMWMGTNLGCRWRWRGAIDAMSAESVANVDVGRLGMPIAVHRAGRRRREMDLVDEGLRRRRVEGVDLVVRQRI